MGNNPEDYDAERDGEQVVDTEDWDEELPDDDFNDEFLK